MKYLKKTGALLLALVMVLALSAPALATDITIDKAQVGETYNAYQIFGLTVSSDGKYAYTISDTTTTSDGTTTHSNPWFETISNFKATPPSGTEKNVFTLTPTEAEAVTTVYVVTVDEAFKDTTDANKPLAFSDTVAKNLAEALNTAYLAMDSKPTATGSATGEENEGSTEVTATITGLPAGYYFVDSTLGAVCSLGNVYGENAVTIEEKNSLPTILKQVQDDASDDGQTNAEYEQNHIAAVLDICDTVNYKLTITTSDMTVDLSKFNDNNYKIVDTLPQGFTYESGTVEVKSDTEIWSEKKTTVNEGETNGTDYTVSYDTDNRKLTITLLYADSAKLKTKEKKSTITITYQAKMKKQNTNGVTLGVDGNTNTVVLTYHELNPDDYAVVKTYQIGGDATGTTTTPVFVKVDGSTLGDSGTVVETTKKLPGVKFILSKTVNSETKYATVDNNGFLTGWIDNRDEIPAATDGAAATPGATRIETNNNGTIIVKGLDAGTYILTEVETLPGYNLLADTITVVIAENGTVTYQYTSKVGQTGETAGNTITIENNTGTELPSTGGTGTTLFYIIGGILAVGAAVLLITRRRMNADK